MIDKNRGRKRLESEKTRQGLSGKQKQKKIKKQKVKLCLNSGILVARGRVSDTLLRVAIHRFTSTK